MARALARLAAEEGRQVFVVTHLAQVAAFADAQIAVSKLDEGGPHGGPGRVGSTATSGCAS